MISTDSYKLTNCGGGLFSTKNVWIHPPRTEKTFEIIYMVKGKAHFEENRREFTLSTGQLTILYPDTFHRGTRVSEPPTSFYWQHFSLDSPQSLGIPQGHIFDSFSGAWIFPEMLHLEQLCGKEAAEPAIAHLLNCLETNARTQKGDAARLANVVCEWVRANTDAKLTVSAVANHFGYNPEYLSKLAKAYCGASLKNIIYSALITRANDLLDNSEFSIKEISAFLSFDSANAFVNFYKYHQNISPAKYRNRHFKTHINAR